jgi:hypothetical protein
MVEVLLRSDLSLNLERHCVYEAGMNEISLRTLGRALQLLQDGSCETVADLRRTLLKEGIPQADIHLAGLAINSQCAQIQRTAMLRISSCRAAATGVFRSA